MIWWEMWGFLFDPPNSSRPWKSVVRKNKCVFPFLGKAGYFQVHFFYVSFKEVYLHSDSSQKNQPTIHVMSKDTVPIET